MFKRFWWVFLVMLPAGAMAGFMVAAVITYVMPKKYESETTIEVKPISRGEVGQPQTSPQYYATEFNKIKSHSSLKKVMENLELANKWGVDQEAAVRILKGIVTTENIRGTDLISIRVRHTNKEETRDIALEVAKVYRDYRKEIVSRDQEKYLMELNTAVKDQEERLEDARRIYTKLTRNMGAHPSLSMHDEASDTPEEKITRAQDKQDIIDAKRDFETDMDLLQKLKLRQISAKTVSIIPTESIVIHEEPLISNVPVSPNVTLNLVLGLVIGFLTSPLLALPLMWLLNRLNPVKEGRTSADMA